MGYLGRKPREKRLSSGNRDWTDNHRVNCFRTDWRGDTIYQRINDGPFNYGTAAKRSGVAVPDWKGKIARGENATSAFTASRTTFEPSFRYSWYWERHPTTYPLGRRMVYDPGYISIVHAIQAANRPGLSVDETTANNYALRKLYQRLRESRTSVQGWTVLGELKKTIEGIRHPGMAARKLLAGHVTTCGKAARKFSRPGDVARAWSGSWLETNYGLKPLLNDIAGIVDAAIEVKRNHFPNQRLSASGKDERSYNAMGIHNNQWRWTDQVIKSVIVKYTVGIKLTGSTKEGYYQQQWTDRLGLRLDEFIPTAWELAPWSFLVDYFSNVGDVLDAISLSTENVVYVSKTVRTETYTEFTCKLDGEHMSKSYTSPWEFAYGGSDEQKIITRTKALTRGPSVLGIPTLQFQLPSVSQWTNIGALITQATVASGKPQVLRRGYIGTRATKAWNDSALSR